MEEKQRQKLRSLLNDTCIQIMVSNPKQKGGVSKIKLRPIFMNQILAFQESRYEGDKVFHKNLDIDDVQKSIEGYLEVFKQVQITTEEENLTILSGKKGNLTFISKKNKAQWQAPDLSHNRTKNYILEEGKAVPFLVDLGVMTKEGKVVQSKYAKFRQINRFLEFLEDILPELPQNRELTIIDFGCGKSYLTFAIYYYLNILKGYSIQIIGLDLKEDVIRKCNELQKKYGYENLKFLQGDIASYEEVDKVDMVVTLHACDTATDYALAKAVKWGAKVILSVPCCQHELNGQIKSDLLEPILQYGIIKERTAALFTDALRAQYLEQMGYRTQLLEFIDMEHTPKNILIRGIFKGKCANNMEKIEKIKEFLQIEPILEKLL